MSAPAARHARAYVIGCAALCGWALGYALPSFARLPNLYYDPVGRRFLVGGHSGPVPMGYLGQVLYASAGALALSAAASLSLSLRRREPSEQAIGLLAAWALTALALVGAYFTWNNWP